MDRLGEAQLGRTVLVLRWAPWFLVGLAVSAVFVVWIPPLDLVLLLALTVATVTLRLRAGRFSPRVTPMLIGVIAFSVYTLTWAVAFGASGSSVGSGGALILPLHPQ